jgi:hypothetical protein
MHPAWILRPKSTFLTISILVTGVIWYFEPHGKLNPRSIYIHGILNPLLKTEPPLYGKLNPHGILNPLREPNWTSTRKVKQLLKPSFKLLWEPLIFQQNIYRRKIHQQCYRNWPNLSRQLEFQNGGSKRIWNLTYSWTGNFLLAWAGQFSGIENQTMHRFEHYLKILQLYHENSRFPPRWIVHFVDIGGMNCWPLRIGECPSNSPFLKNNGAEAHCF